MKLILPAMMLILAASAPAAAETVDVKYHGPVALDTFECHDTVSSFVHRVCHQADARYMVVLLNETYYHYCEIGADIVAGLLAAESKGRFYNQNIRSNAVDGRFTCEGKIVPTF